MTRATRFGCRSSAGGVQDGHHRRSCSPALPNPPCTPNLSHSCMDVSARQHQYHIPVQLLYNSSPLNPNSTHTPLHTRRQHLTDNFPCCELMQIPILPAETCVCGRMWHLACGSCRRKHRHSTSLPPTSHRRPQNHNRHWRFHSAQKSHGLNLLQRSINCTS
jgi:hypothetical protein